MPGYSKQKVLLAALLLFLSVAAMPQDARPAGDPNKTYQLAGTVVNSVNGRPIARALVQLSSSNRAMLTGPEGDFSFDNLPPGTVELQAQKPGYFPAGFSGASGNGNSPRRFQVGPETGKIVLKLAPAAMISGTVTGSNGEPLEDVWVSVLKSDVIEGRRQLHRGQGVSTDEDGNFRLTGLPAGRYYLAINVNIGSWANKLSGTKGGNSIETYPAVVYFPGSNNPEDATPMDLTPGQHEEADFTLRRVPGFKVAGVIANGAEWKQLNFVRLLDEFEQPLFTADRLEKTGAFEFQAVPAGTYLLEASAQTRDGRSISNNWKITVQSQITQLRIVIQAIDIPVIVRKDFLRPNTGRARCTSTSSSGEVRVSDCSDYPAINLELDSKELPMQIHSEGGPLKGAFSIRGVPPGRYNVKATAVFGGYIQSLRCGGLDLLREALLVPEGGNVAPIEVMLRDDAASLKIKVRSETQIDQQMMVLVVADPATIAEPHARMMTQGTDVYAGQLPPGAYKIFVFHADDDPDSVNLHELEKYAAKATSITLGPNENASVAVDPIRVGE